VGSARAQPRPHGALVPLRYRDFRFLLGANAISLLGDNVVTIALSFAVLDLTGSIGDLGLVLLGRISATLVFVLAGGVWADRVSRRGLMITADLSRAVIQAALCALLLSGRAEIWMLVALQFAHGIAGAFFRPAGSAVVPLLLPAEHRQPGNAMLYSVLSAGGIVGPALASLLIAAVGPAGAIGFDGVTFLASATLLSRIGHLDQPPPPGRPFLRDLATGWDAVRSRTWLWAFIVDFSAFQMIVIAGYLVIGPYVAKTSLDGASSWALLAGASGVGAVLGSVLGMRWRPARPLVAVAGAMAVPLLFLLGLAGPAPMPALVGSAVLYGAGTSFGGAIWESTLQNEVPVELLSRVVSYDWLGSTALRPVGLAMMGPLVGLIGLHATVYTLVAVFGAVDCALLGVRETWRVRSR
jgi:MFS family permease